MKSAILCVGSHTTKVGRSGEEEPLASITTANDLDRFIISDNRSVDTDSMTPFLGRCFSFLGVATETPLLLVSASASPGNALNRDLVELLFEDFGIPSLCLAASTEVSYLSISENSGIILDIGDTQTTATAVYERHVIASKSTSGLAGRWVSYHLYDLIKDQQKANQSRDRYSLLGSFNNLKEQHCYVATPNFEAECQLQLEKPSLKKQVDLSGLFSGEAAEKITLAAERFIAPDLLFNPSLDDKDSLGIQHLIYDVLMESHPTMRPFLTSNIQLVGGTSRFPGLADRLKFELNWIEEDLFSTSHIQLLHANTEWLGSSLLSSLSDFPSLLVTKDQFLEQGSIGRNKSA